VDDLLHFAASVERGVCFDLGVERLNVGSAKGVQPTTPERRQDVVALAVLVRGNVEGLPR
jgi:hypothetical protein